MELELNNRADAEKWLKKSLHDYSNYMNENYVHIRAYAALRELGISSDKHSVDQTQCKCIMQCIVIIFIRFPPIRKRGWRLIKICLRITIP